MPIPVSLQDIVGQVHLLDALSTAYLNRRTGEVAIVSEEDALLADAPPEPPLEPLSEWERDWASTVREVRGADDWLALPGRFELHPYRVMEQFCLSIPTEEGGETLLSAIRGRGAFRRFRDEASRLGLHARWYAFQDDAYRRIIAGWLEAHEIPYHTDLHCPPALSNHESG